MCVTQCSTIWFSFLTSDVVDTFEKSLDRDLRHQERPKEASFLQAHEQLKEVYFPDVFSKKIK